MDRSTGLGVSLSDACRKCLGRGLTLTRSSCLTTGGCEDFRISVEAMKSMVVAGAVLTHLGRTLFFEGRANILEKAGDPERLVKKWLHFVARGF